MRKRILVGLMFGVFALGSPIYINNPQVIIEASASVKPIYDNELSVVTIKPEARGKTYFSYKIDGEYPTYQKDTVSYFNADGSMKEQKTDMLNKPIFTDDIATWIDVTKTTPNVSPDSDYYKEVQKGDSYTVLPYTDENKDNEFYIPVTKVDSKVSINVVNVSDSGKVSKVKTYDYSFSGVLEDSPKKKDITIRSISKDNSSETIRISGDNIDYVYFDSEYYRAKKNSVDIKLTSNGKMSFYVFSRDTDVPDVLNYRVKGLKEGVDTKITNERVDDKNPVITTDKVPIEQQTKKFKFKVYTDKPCIISCNGKSVKGTEYSLYIHSNGKYLITATDMSGNYAEKTVKIDCFSTDGYKLDKEHQWGTKPETKQVSEKVLPKTGGISWLSLIAIGFSCIVAGIGFIVKGGTYDDNRKRNKDI